MHISTSTIRVNNHNNWPAVELFPCEKMFVERMARLNVQQIFLTATLTPSDADEPFNAAVGHILDCLDSLPRRPDAAFDCLYKVIDQNLTPFERPNTSRVISAVDSLFEAEPAYWSAIADLLSTNIPQQTADYAAGRILECHVSPNPPHSDEMKKRAKRSIGARRYDQLCRKFLVPNPQNAALLELPYNKKRDAGRLLRMMFTQRAPRSQTKVSPSDLGSLLDISIQANVLSPREKLRALMEICVATYRHERFHGEAFSPFRSSKATLKTYAHAYYLLLVAYVVVLGLLQQQKKGGLNAADIYRLAEQSIERFSVFFCDVLNE